MVQSPRDQRGVEGQPTPGERRSSGASRGPITLVTTIMVIGLVATGLVSWASWRADQNNERRLVRVQTRQAANVISAAILGLQSPLRAAVEVGAAGKGAPDQFSRFMSTYVGPGRLFVAASLVRTGGSAPVVVQSEGTAPDQPPTSAEGQAFLARAGTSKTFAVKALSSSDHQRVAYAMASVEDPSYVVYAEREIPANRRVEVESDSAFLDLHFATYLGASTRLEDLQTTDLPPGRLPLAGTTATQQIPFGDSTLTLVTSPATHLGGRLEQLLPWIFLAGGTVLSAFAALLAGKLARRRRAAETDTQTIGALYEEMDRLYGEQRTIAETLQHALLPQRNPAIPGLAVATRYVAGAKGVDIGGDWFSIIALDEHHFGFVVGDVSGRGVEAASLMARVRFTLRAYLAEGHPPDRCLELCARQVDIVEDGHMVTALVGFADTRTREVTLANAGHPNPLVIADGGLQFASTEAGPPLGVAVGPYPTATLQMPTGSTLLAFTDGLVERRDEDIDVGLGRLAQTAGVEPAAGPLEELVTAVLTAMVGSDAEDDVAVLAFRWEGIETQGEVPAKRTAVGA